MDLQKQLIVTDGGTFEVTLTTNMENSFVIHVASLTHASYDILTGLLIDETDIQKVYGWITSGDSYVLSRQRLNAHDWSGLDHQHVCLAEQLIDYDVSEDIAIFLGHLLGDSLDISFFNELRATGAMIQLDPETKETTLELFGRVAMATNMEFAKHVFKQLRHLTEQKQHLQTVLFLSPEAIDALLLVAGESFTTSLRLLNELPKDPNIIQVVAEMCSQVPSYSWARIWETATALEYMSKDVLTKLFPNQSEVIADWKQVNVSLKTFPEPQDAYHHANIHWMLAAMGMELYGPKALVAASKTLDSHLLHRFPIRTVWGDKTPTEQQIQDHYAMQLFRKSLMHILALAQFSEEAEDMDVSLSLSIAGFDFCD